MCLLDNLADSADCGGSLGASKSMEYGWMTGWTFSRFKNEVTVRSTSNYKDQVLNYHVSHQTKINGHFVAPIIITRRGKTGYIPLTNGNGDPINIYMTKEEVDTFNQNFTEKDYDQINHYSLFGNYKTTINNTGE